jgi:hypothetical protein
MTKYLSNFANDISQYTIFRAKYDRDNRKKDVLFGTKLREEEAKLEVYKQHIKDQKKAQKQREKELVQDIKEEKTRLQKIIDESKARVEEREKVIKNLTPYYLESSNNIYFGYTVKTVNDVLNKLKSEKILNEKAKVPDTLTFNTKNEGEVTFVNNRNYKPAEAISKNVLFGYPK